MDIKKCCKKIFVPSIWVTVLCALLSTIGLTAVFTKGWERHVGSAVVYAVSAYSLTILIIACYKVLPGYYRETKARIYENKYARRYLTDVTYKTRVNLYRSLVINLFYAGMNGVSAYIYETNWFAIFAIYYAILAIMRFILVRYGRKSSLGENPETERIRARICAYILMTVNLTLSGAVLMMIYYDKGFEYRGYLIYVMALYAFYATISATISMVKYRKYKSPVMSMSVVIKLAAALFSMLFLETAMLSQFGQDTNPETKRILIMATGAGISVIVTTVAVYMIVRWTKEINALRSKG